MWKDNFTEGCQIMTITNIEPINRSKYKIYINDEFAFVLYKGELSKYHIAKDVVITEETIALVKNEVLLKRAKMRAMYLLNAMPRTEQQLREKLTQNGYPGDVIDGAVQYVKSFGYINDESYIRNFILGKKQNKSKREIIMLLEQKGLKGELVDTIVEEMYEEDSEVSTIRELMRKKRWDPSEMEMQERQKAFAYFMRKGFSYEEIRKAF